ncbi:MAG TPA: dienelactone hydrolase family protein [Polyangia bacterium]
MDESRNESAARAEAQTRANPSPGPAASRSAASSPKIDQGLYDLFDRYVHGIIDRRGFLDGAAKFAVGGMTAAGLLDLLNPRFAQAQQISTDDKRIKIESISYDSPQGSGKMRGYLARPSGGKGKLPAVLVIHENRGLNPHIEDVTRRFAVEGYLAFAPDALTPLGGYPGDEDKARALFGTLDQAKAREDFVAAVGYLTKHPSSTGKVGVVGFCYGGAMANTLATRVPTLAGAVAFYGTAPKEAAEIAKIKSPLVLHYAENDERVNATMADYEAALKANKVKYELHKYPGTQHGFHNDTTPRYDKAAATLAWQRTLAFFTRTLKPAGGAGKSAPG